MASSLELPLKGIKKSNEEFKIFFETVLNAKKDPQPSFLYSAQGSGGLAFGGAPPAPQAAHLAFATQMEMDYLN